MKYLVLFFCLFVSVLKASETVDVLLFSDAKLSEVRIRPNKGKFAILALESSGKIIDTIDLVRGELKERMYTIIDKGNVVQLLRNGTGIGTYHQIMFVADHLDSRFIIAGKGRERMYNGDVIVRNYKGDFQIINRVDTESYVAGVVESEGGHSAEYAYLKAQAVLARTWLVKNRKKHLNMGYNVKDDVSSQAYVSTAYLQNSEAIWRAVRETRDSILTDLKGVPVLGVFHANSGGQTLSVEDVWNEKVSYLKGVKDDYSLKGSHANWEKSVSKEDFIAFFASKCGMSAVDKDFRKEVCSINQDKERLAWFEYKGKRVKMRLVREQFKLKSSFFTVVDNGSTLLLKGHGYGHGVGMSQEGAMEMAKQGKNYMDILLHYFANTKMTHISNMNFEM